MKIEFTDWDYRAGTYRTRILPAYQTSVLGLVVVRTDPHAWQVVHDLSRRPVVEFYFDTLAQAKLAATQIGTVVPDWSKPDPCGAPHQPGEFYHAIMQIY